MNTRILTTCKVMFTLLQGIMGKRDLTHQPVQGLLESDNVSAEASKVDDLLPSSSILFNTLPKSGSVSIVESLSAVIGKGLVQISPGYYPFDMVDFRSFQSFSALKGIAQAHLDPSSFNSKYISRIDKVVLHLRDPRQSTLSWTHHLERLKAGGQEEFLLTIDPVLPDNYFSLEFQQKLDYQLINYLQQSISWINSWVTHIEQANKGDQYMISRFEDFILDPQSFYAQLFDFLLPGLSDVISTPVAVREGDKNFRCGLINEWETVFSPAQLGMAREIVPANLLDRFGWKR